MRIGMILDAVFPPDPRVENEALTLIKAGHEVYLFCLYYANETENEQLNGIHIRRYLTTKFEYKMSALVYTFPFYTNRMTKKIEHFINENKIDTVHIHDIQIAKAAFKAVGTINIPAVLDLHENRPEIMKFYTHLQKLPGKYLIYPSVWKKREEEFVKNSKCTVVVTEEAKNELIERTKVKDTSIIVVPNTVRETFYSEAIINTDIKVKYKDSCVLLYLGDTGLRRGLLTAIESLKKIKESVPNIKLVLVGTSSADAVLKKRVKELHIEKYVDFEGWQNVSLFPSYIAASTICISPLHRNKHHDTTYANKIFQYMSFAKPLLVSNATAQETIVEKSKSGLVHREKDSDDFSNKVLKLVSNKVLRKQMGENGKYFIENEFSWEQTSKNLVDLYESLNTKN